MKKNDTKRITRNSYCDWQVERVLKGEISINDVV
jgi:hypothetical protein